MGPGERRLKQLIVTGDDFGLSQPVNEAIEIAHRDGVLTATCLMVGAPMATQAVALAKRLPRLAVGLHVVVTRGTSVLPLAAVPDLVDAEGRFDDNLVRAGFRYFFLPRVRRQLAQEIRAQFEAFRATGLDLDHVSGHNHMHLHPTVLGLILRIGRDFGAPAVRVPFEPLAGPEATLGRAAGWLFLAPWTAWMKWRLRRAGLHHNHLVFGMRDVGRMDRSRLLSVLRRLPEGVSELICHPATGAWAGIDPAASGFRFKDELAALVDPEVRGAIALSGAELSSYRSSRGGTHGR